MITYYYIIMSWKYEGFRSASQDRKQELFKQIFNEDRLEAFRKKCSEGADLVEFGFGDVFSLVGEKKTCYKRSANGDMRSSICYLFTLERVCDNMKLHQSYFYNNMSTFTFEKYVQIKLWNPQCAKLGCLRLADDNLPYCAWCVGSSSNLCKMSASDVCAVCMDTERKDLVMSNPSVCTHFYHYQCLVPLIRIEDQDRDQDTEDESVVADSTDSTKMRDSFACPQCRKSWPTRSMVSI